MRARRSSGTNPRALGSNPRALGRNQRAGGSAADALDVEHGRLIRRAVALMHARGDVWCRACADQGWRPTPDGYVPCGELHRVMRPGDAREVIEAIREAYRA